MIMEYRVCSRCIIDTTVPAVKFDDKGECNYCKLHDKLDKEYTLNKEGEKRFKKIIETINMTAYWVLVEEEIVHIHFIY